MPQEHENADSMQDLETAARRADSIQDWGPRAVGTVRTAGTVRTVRTVRPIYTVSFVVGHRRRH